jgi:hypothetical protein
MLDTAKPHEPIIKDENSETRNDRSRKNPGEPQTGTGTDVKVPYTPARNGGPTKKQKNPHERWRAGLTAIAVVVSICAAVITLSSRNAAWKSAASSSRSADAAQESVATAKAALEIADRSVRVAIDALIASTRPWVGVKGIEPLGKMIPGKPFYVRVKFKNVGNSPGLDVGGNSYFSPVIKAREVKRVPLRDLSVLGLCMLPKPQWSERITGGFILPGEEYMWIDQPTAYPMNETTIKLVKGREEDEPVISPEEWQQFRWTIGVGPKDLVKKKTVGLYLVGCINYFDEFKNPHRTNFCFRYERAIGKKDSSFSMCRDGNDAD